MLLVVGCWLLVVGCWLLVGGWWLLVGGWWLVVGGWLMNLPTNNKQLANKQLANKQPITSNYKYYTRTARLAPENSPSRAFLPRQINRTGVPSKPN